MYQKDAIKEISPEITYMEAVRKLDSIGFFDSGKINDFLMDTDIKNELGAFVSSMIIDLGPGFELQPSGKGISLAQCLSSMYMELVERMSIKYMNDHKKSLSKKVSDTEYKNLLEADEEFAFIDALLSQKQAKLGKNVPYDGKAKDSTFLLQAINLVDNKEKYIPYDLLSYNISDGWNVGNTKDEAILGGIYEVVERYCFKSFFEGNYKDIIEVKNIDIISIITVHPDLESLISKNLESDRISGLRLLEINLVGTNIYTYILSGDYIYEEVFYCYGLGAHTDQRIGIIRAFTEFIQSIGVGKSSMKKKDVSKGSLTSSYFTSLLKDKINSFTKSYEYSHNVVNIDSIQGFLTSAIGELLNIGVNHIYCYHVKNLDMDVPTYVVKVPRFGQILNTKYNSRYYVDSVPELKICNNIEGIGHLFHYIADNELDEEKLGDLKGIYFDMIGYMCDEQLNEYLRKIYKVSIQGSGEYLVDVEKDNPLHYYYFKNILDKESKSYEDYLYLFEIYARIGFLDYAIIYLKKAGFDNNQSGFDNIYENYLENYNLDRKGYQEYMKKTISIIKALS